MSWQQIRELDETSRRLTGIGAIPSPVFLHRFACIDGRCRWATYRGQGQRPVACKQHRLPGAHVTHRNARAVVRRLEHDARRARGKFGLPSLALYESHSQCAYRAWCGHMSEATGWEHFRHHLKVVPDMTLAWVRRDVGTGSMTVVGRHGSVDAATLPTGLDTATLVPRLQDIGYADAAVAMTLAACLVGNVAYRATTPHSDQHEEEGVIVGAHLYGHRHFAVDNRAVDDLEESLEVAADLLRRRELRQRPFLLAAIGRNPRRSHDDYDRARHLLLAHIRAALRRLGQEDVFDLFSGTVCKGSGQLCWQAA